MNVFAPVLVGAILCAVLLPITLENAAHILVAFCLGVMSGIVSQLGPTRRQSQDKPEA